MNSDSTDEEILLFIQEEKDHSDLILILLKDCGKVICSTCDKCRCGGCYYGCTFCYNCKKCETEIMCYSCFRCTNVCKRVGCQVYERDFICSSYVCYENKHCSCFKCEGSYCGCGNEP
jgi:hypothetical protein